MNSETPNASPGLAVETSPSNPGRWPSKFLCLGFAVLCVTTAELLFKRGAVATANLPDVVPAFGFTVLASGWTWLGIVAYISGFLAWLNVLRQMPLHLAFSIMSVDQALVPLCAWALLGESISLRRVCGILLVIAGIIVIARPAMQSGEKL